MEAAALALVPQTFMLMRNELRHHLALRFPRFIHWAILCPDLPLLLGLALHVSFGAFCAHITGSSLPSAQSFMTS